jgi:thiol-disulfide isomerase/thioredoxin
MASDWILRLALAIGLILVGWLAYKLAQRLSLTRAGKFSNRIAGSTNGLPTIVLFTTPDCVPCKVAQVPALHRLEKMLDHRLQVIEVDTYENPDMAREWGVMSVPTTFILDERGEPQEVTYGVTTAEKLYVQVQKAIQPR